MGSIDEGTCMLAITSYPTPGMDFILGQPFLHTVYTAFSMEDPPHVSIGKLECSDGVDDTISNNVIGIVMGIVLFAIFLGLVLWLLFVHPGSLMLLFFSHHTDILQTAVA